MMVDSGASIVALTRRDAEAIGIDVDSLPIGGMARTAGGDVPMRTVTLGSVVVEGIEVRQVPAAVIDADMGVSRSEEHTSELQSLMRISYAVFCLKKKNYTNQSRAQP